MRTMPEINSARYGLPKSRISAAVVFSISARTWSRSGGMFNSMNISRAAASFPAPSREAKPSEGDLRITKRLVSAHEFFKSIFWIM